MAAVAKPLIYVAVIAFLGAVVTSFTGTVVGITPESLSRASSNLALIAIGLALLEKQEGAPPVT